MIPFNLIWAVAVAIPSLTLLCFGLDAVTGPTDPEPEDAKDSESLAV